MAAPLTGARQVVLTTSRTILTTWVDGDAEDLHRLHSDPETMRHVRNGRPETRGEVESLVRGYVAAHAATSWAKWRVTDKEGNLIGRAGFGGTDEARAVSYLVARPLWGKGLATEICAGLVDWHLTHAPCSELRALVACGNDASDRVLLKTGFAVVGPEDYDGIPCTRYAYPVAV